METVVGEAEVLPITIPEALSSIRDLIVDVVRKNRTMIDYYIYPKETPSEVEAYKPGLQHLYGRVESLAALDLPKLTLLVDDAEALVSAFLLPIVDQLLNAIHGIQTIFINHYDRDLEFRKPYQNVYSALEYREKQLKKFQEQQMRSPQRRLPESLITMPPSSVEPSFCRFAVAYTNHRDHGKVAQVMPEDLTSEDRDKLKTSGGAYLSWDCPGCAFKLKFHIINSVACNIQMTDDLRCHSSAPNVDYRPVFLIKCHLYQANKGRKDSTRLEDRRDSVTDTRRGSTARRQSDARRTSKPLFFLPNPRRTKSEVITEKYTISKDRTSSAKYGCPFCFAVGRDYGHMAYRNGRELAEHIESRHHPGRPPSSLLLEKYMVALNGRCAENVRKWDINIRGR